VKRPLTVVLLLVAATTLSSASFAGSREAGIVTSDPSRATLATFAGGWNGHTRHLVITRSGHAREYIDDGCCHPVIDLMFRLSRPHGTLKIAAATATATAVWVRDRSAFTKAFPAPRVGEQRTLRLRNGVITETLTGAKYCDDRAAAKGTCGA
jgi:hypothetical protein